MRIGRRGTGSLVSWLWSSILVVISACAPPSVEEWEEEEGKWLEALEGYPVEPLSIDPSRELFITHTGVVDDSFYTAWDPRKTNTDPKGGWSFGRLIDNMLPLHMRTSYGRSQFVLNWLKTWEQDQTVNGRVIPARPLIRSVLIDPWKKASGCILVDEVCLLDFSKAPFRLLAIVNRPDLRQVPTATERGYAGQGRFIFGALGPTGARLPFTVIFEYQLPVSRRSDILSWAHRWHSLGSMAFGASYNEKLHHVTREFTRRDAAPGRVNGSALLQIRTNEVPLSPSVDPTLWEMREFVLGASGLLRPATVKQEVDASLNGTATLGAWVSANASAILAGQHVVPATFQGQPFLAASAPVPADLAWQVPGVSEEVRHAFALATCSGCHKSETGTNFLHVRSREVGSPAPLSDFLTQELSPTGPRVTDFQALLGLGSADMVMDGNGRDHPDAKEGDD